jgi:sirohydrochlorin cobaltochelatase
MRHYHFCLGLLIMLTMFSLGAGDAAAASRPAIVLTAFGTATAAADTYQHIDALARQRFPEHDIRWAYTSRKVRAKVKEEQGRELKDLPQVLSDLKAAGVAQVAVQSLHVVPGEEWERKIVQEVAKVPGLKAALGQPLLSTFADYARVLDALARTCPQNLQETAVVLAGHGSPSPSGEAVYLAFEKALRAKFPQQNVFLGMVAGKPEAAAALQAAAKSPAQTVVFIPFMVVAGEHMHKDIMGDDPESWKSQLLKLRQVKVEGVFKGLGFNDAVAAVFLDHLQEALNTLK